MSSNNIDSKDGIKEEEAEKIDADEKLDMETYDTSATPEEIVRIPSWGLRLRAFVSKFGTEEGGIERISPEARTNQNPRGMNRVATS
jgi:hypothetical protein